MVGCGYQNRVDRLIIENLTQIANNFRNPVVFHSGQAFGEAGSVLGVRVANERDLAAVGLGELPSNSTAASAAADDAQTDPLG